MVERFPLVIVLNQKWHRCTLNNIEYRMSCTPKKQPTDLHSLLHSSFGCFLQSGSKTKSNLFQTRWILWMNRLLFWSNHSNCISYRWFRLKKRYYKTLITIVINDIMISKSKSPVWNRDRFLLFFPFIFIAS